MRKNVLGGGMMNMFKGPPQPEAKMNQTVANAGGSNLGTAFKQMGFGTST